MAIFLDSGFLTRHFLRNLCPKFFTRFSDTAVFIVMRHFQDRPYNMTDNQGKRKYLLNGLNEFLKAHNFKKKDFTFKRETENGFIQIIELRLGPAWTSKAGEISLEFGIFSNEWHKYFASWKVPSIVRTADCEIRDCYCSIVEKKTNQNWFSLSESPSELLADILTDTKSRVLPFLDKLKTRNEVLSLYAIHGESIGLPPRHKLSIAILNYGVGNYENSMKLAFEEYSSNAKNPFYERVYTNLKIDISKTNA